MSSRAALLPIFRLSKARGGRIPAGVFNPTSNAGKAKKARNPGEDESGLGWLAALLAPHRSLRACSSLAPYHQPRTALARRGRMFQEAPKRGVLFPRELPSLAIARENPAGLEFALWQATLG